MTEQQHPITPPPELVQQWLAEGHHQDYCSATKHAIAQAARWGADQELEACCEWLGREVGSGWGLGAQLRAARRPKPPSLKKQALDALNTIEDKMLGPTIEEKLIRRALEQLND